MANDNLECGCLNRRERCDLSSTPGSAPSRRITEGPAFDFRYNPLVNLVHKMGVPTNLGLDCSLLAMSALRTRSLQVSSVDSKSGVPVRDRWTLINCHE